MKPPTRSPGQSHNRWKLACALFAALSGYALWTRGTPANTPAETVTVGTRTGALPERFRAPLHISTEAAGVSQRELVDGILAARTVRDIGLLADKLGLVGDDTGIDAV